MKKKSIFLLVFIIFFIVFVYAQEGEKGSPYSVEEPEDLTLEELFLGLPEISLDSIEQIVEAGDNHDLLLTMIEILKNNGSDRAIDLLIDVLDIGVTNVKIENGLIVNNFWDVRVEACIALGELKAEKAVEKLIYTLINDPDPIVKTYAAMSLGKIGDKKAVQPLIRILKFYRTEYKSTNAPLIYGLIIALGELGDPAAFAILLEISQGPYPQFIKQTAITAIKKIQSSS